MDETNEQLAQQAQSGCDAAAATLIDRFYRPIYAFHRRRTSNDEDAADLTQRTFSAAWQALSEYRENALFATWLYRIAHHTYVDWVRQRSRQIARDTRWWESRSQSEARPFDELEDRDFAARIYTLVANLDEALRHPIELHFYEHLTIAQTAEVLALSPSTVKNRLRTAIDHLKHQSQTTVTTPGRP